MGVFSHFLATLSTIMRIIVFLELAVTNVEIYNISLKFNDI
jgi:hypothetical protein